MKRRGFLKLLATTLAAAGVSAVTITNVFDEPKADKMKVGEAIRRIVKRFETAKTQKERMKIAYDALCVISEAHQDHSLVWAGGAVLYYAQLNGDVNALIKVAAENKNNPRTKAFLDGLRTVLGPDHANPGRAVLYQYETAMACREMGGVLNPISEWTLRELEKHHPEVYAEHMKEHAAAA